MSFEGSEFHHMVRVTRHQVGDTVRLFDGTGKEADALVEVITRNSASLKVGKVETLPPESGPFLILAVAMPKVARAGWLIEKAVELGVSRIIPIRTQRGVVDPRETKLETLRATVIAASKQCGRSRLMEIDAVHDWNTFLKKVVASHVTTIAHPGGLPFAGTLVNSLLAEAVALSETNRNVSNDTLLTVIGPEGGFTIEEVTQVTAHGGRIVSLGSRILRMETAALYVASVFNSAVS